MYSKIDQPQPQLPPLLPVVLATIAAGDGCCGPPRLLPLAATRLPSLAISAAASAACFAACARCSAGASSQSTSSREETHSTTSSSSTTRAPPRQCPQGICMAAAAGRRTAWQHAPGTATAAANSDPARFGAGYLQLEFTNTSMTHDKWQLQVIKGVCSQLHIFKDALACEHDARQQQWRGGGDYPTAIALIALTICKFVYVGIWR